MGKSIAKEIIIGLLLCLAILLVMAVMMYSFIPNNKVIPEPIKYSAPEEVKKVLDEAATDSSQVILTYEVNASDLSIAQRTNDYNPGKVNPFSSYQVQKATPEEGSNSSTGGISPTGRNTSGNSSSGTSSSGRTSESTTESGTSTNTNTSGGTYYKDKGTK